LSRHRDFRYEALGGKLVIVVHNVRLSELAKPPYQASISFQNVLHTLGTRQQRACRIFVAQVDFSMLDQVSNDFVRRLQISYFRVDKAFKKEQR
jgi:hypothetical protein